MEQNNQPVNIIDSLIIKLEGEIHMTWAFSVAWFNGEMDTKIREIKAFYEFSNNPPRSFD